MLDKMHKERIIKLIEQLNEDIGKLQIKNDLLQIENESLKADLKGKDNDINDLKARIKYLKQFMPNTEEMPTRQG